MPARGWPGDLSRAPRIVNSSLRWRVAVAVFEGGMYGVEGSRHSDGASRDSRR